MTTREQFKRAVIEAIHGLPYEEAVEKEFGKIGGLGFRYSFIDEDNGNEHVYSYMFEKIENGYIHLRNGQILKIKEMLGYPITIGRVMQAWSWNIETGWGSHREGCATFFDSVRSQEIANWKLTKENGQECTDEDQSEETISKLLNLLQHES